MMYSLCLAEGLGLRLALEALAPFDIILLCIDGRRHSRVRLWGWITDAIFMRPACSHGAVTYRSMKFPEYIICGTKY